MSLLLYALSGCASDDPKDTGCTGTACDTAGDTGSGDTGSGDSGGDSGDSGGDSGDDTGLPDGLYGTAPDKRIPAPEFTVQNQDSQPRTRDDLLGHPTVVWFYPAATTGG